MFKPTFFATGAALSLTVLAIMAAPCDAAGLADVGSTPRHAPQSQVAQRSHTLRHAPRSHVRRYSHEEWRRGRWVHGRHDGHVGWWWVIGVNWFLYPQPVYPYPQQIVVLPPASAPYCRQFSGDAIVDVTGQPFYGTACLQADGRWHIVP